MFTPSFFKTSRKLVLDELLKSVDASEKSVIFLKGGEETARYDTDRDLLFRQESNFWYMTGVVKPDYSLIITLDDLKVHLFAPLLPEAYAVWLGEIEPLDAIHARHETDFTGFTEKMKDFLTEYAPSKVYTTPFSSSHSVLEGFDVNKDLLKKALDEVRVIKRTEELAALRIASDVSSKAHMAAMKATKPGMKELQVEANYKFVACLNEGRFLSFCPIVAGGDGSATLHYMDNDKVIKDGDMVLLDAGSEYNLYAGDITRTYPVNGKYTEKQKLIYQIVLDAQNAVLGALKEGIDYTDMHALALRVISEGLLAAGFLQGPIDEIIEHCVGGYFMPHGLGHMMGLDVHDVGGYPEGVDRIDKPSFRSLRTRRILREGMVLTVEPGVYFIKPLLEQAKKDEVISKYINFEKVAEFEDFGGVRIEDDVIILKDGIEDMTTVPKEVEDVEKFLA
jgi:Xaa-Pro dipeptidase